MGLESIRKEIDLLDKRLVLLLARRMSLVRSLARFKKRNALSIADSEREKAIVVCKRGLAKRYNLDPGFVGQIFSRIFRESRKLQKGVFSSFKRENR